MEEELVLLSIPEVLSGGLMAMQAGDEISSLFVPELVMEEDEAWSIWKIMIMR